MVDSETSDTIRFCSYCGTKLDVGARFCKSCGKPVIKAPSSNEHERVKTETEANRPSGTPKKRESVYEGYIHKCPGCGEVLKSFTAVCPVCGFEVRDTQSANAVKELSIELGMIDAQQMPPYQGKDSILKSLIGEDFHSEDKKREAERRFEEKKKEQKANLIINFPVPNTREDMLELMILSSSNIDTKHEMTDIVTKAWLAKMEQVYQRAELTMKSTPEFEQIKVLYDKKKHKIRKHKYKGLALSAFIIGGYVLMLGLISPMGTIGIVVGIIVLALGFMSITIYIKSQKK